MLFKQLARWLLAHKEDFIAYPVADKSINTVLTAGQVKPQEQSIRDIKHLNEEQIKSADALTQKVWQFMDQIKAGQKTYAPVVHIDTNVSIDFMHACQLDIVDDGVYDTLAQNKPQSMELTLSNGKTIQLRRVREGNPVQAYDVFLSDFPWGSYDYNDIERLTQCAFYQQVAIDSLAKESIDLRLSKIWEAGKDVFNKLRLFHDLITFRERELHYSCNGKELTAVFNAVPWEYGKVFILRGKPQALLSVSNQMEHGMDFRPKGERALKKGQGVKLLCPFENKGEALSLALTQEDTIVVGPEAILAPYVSSFQKHNIGFCTFEAMTLEQAELLGVPMSLRPGQAASSSSGIIEKKIAALNTITLFAEKQLRTALQNWSAAVESKRTP